MKVFATQFILCAFLSLLPLPIFSGCRPTSAQIAREYAWAAAYSAQKTAMKASRKLNFQAKKYEVDLHKKASAAAFKAAYQTHHTPSIMPTAVYTQAYDSFLYGKPLKDHIANWKQKNITIIENKRKLAYCQYALLTAKANEINEFEPPFQTTQISDFIPIKTLK